MHDFRRHLHQADGAALALAARAVLLEREALAPRLGGISAPLLFVAGARDAMYPVPTLHAALAALPQARCAVLNSAHVSVLDAPAEATALIDTFLAALPAVPQR